MILVTGANGHLGTATINNLLKDNAGEKIAALVRSEEKGAELKEKGVEIKIGDYIDYSSMQDAMINVDRVLLISSSTLENRVEQHENVIDAAKEGGVEQILYTSILQADKLLSPLVTDHFETEKLLIDSGIPYTVNRHTFYTEFFPMFLGNALETGEWYFPGDGKEVNFAYRTEMAEALANILQEPAKHQNKIYEITSSNAYTLEEYADMLSEAAGKEITYTDVKVDDFTDQLKEAGLDDDTIMMSRMSAETVVNGALSHTSGDLEKLLGRKPKETTEFIKEFVNSES